MTRVEALQREIEKLDGGELAKLRAWFAEYDWQAWDRQLELDIAEGKLDDLTAEPLAAHARGETEPL